MSIVQIPSPSSGSWPAVIRGCSVRRLASDSGHQPQRCSVPGSTPWAHRVHQTLHTHQVSGHTQFQYSTIRVHSHNVCHTLHTQSVIHCTHSRLVVAHAVCGLESECAKSIRYSVNIRSVVMHNVRASWSERTKSVRHYTQQVSGHPQSGLYRLSCKKFC